jgi:curved DNA-binding protein CbpA
MDRVHTHYDNLKVTRNAPAEVIKAAYRAMAQKYHPDINKSPDAARVMKIVNEAWAVLSDPGRRADHDRWIASEEKVANEKARAPKSTESTFKAGSTEFSYTKPASSSGAPYRANGEPRKTNPQHSSGSGYSAHPGTATEGYKASTPDWIRSVIELVGQLSKKFNVSHRSIYISAFLLLSICALFLYINISSKPSGKADGRNIASAERKLPRNSDVLDSGSDSSPSNSVSTSQKFKPNPSAAPTQRSPEYTFKPIKEDKDKFEVISVPKRQSNGYLKDERQIFAGGYSTFTIDNSNGSHDAEVRLYLGTKQVRSMFVQVGTKFTAEKLSPGTYKLRYKMSINGVDKAFQAKEDFTLSQTVTETETGTRTQFSRMTVTLFKVRDGNMQTEEIPLGSF